MRSAGRLGSSSDIPPRSELSQAGRRLETNQSGRRRRTPGAGSEAECGSRHQRPITTVYQWSTTMDWLRALVASIVLCQAASMAQSPEVPTVPNLPDVRQELLKLVVADQWDRGVDMFSGRQVKAPESLDWKEIERRDAERRAAVRSMLNAG